MSQVQRKICIVGLGYVGLPLACAFGEKHEVLGFDVNAKRIEALRQGRDWTNEQSAEELHRAKISPDGV